MRDQLALLSFASLVAALSLAALGCGDRSGPDASAPDASGSSSDSGLTFPDSSAPSDTPAPPSDEGAPDEDTSREDTKDAGSGKDPGPSQEDVGCVDNDGDGEYGKTGSCPGGKDCNDKDKKVYPGAEEICGDKLDQDCDGKDTSCCLDGDSDGVYGKTPTCPDGTDCDDTKAGIHPTAKEVCGDTIDQDCDGKDEPCCVTKCDGMECGDDGCGGQCGTCTGDKVCSAEKKCVEPSSPDSCEGKCGVYDATADCQCDSGCSEYGDCCADLCDFCAEAMPGQCGCLDGDGDGYGEGPECKGPDCNDANAKLNPDAEDVCGDGIDQDCDGQADDGCAPEECTEESDKDKDGFGSASTCQPKDCNDADPKIYPGAAETCGDTIDQDCDGKDKVCPVTDCLDGDGDGYGTGADCKGPDCNDKDPGINPAAPNDPCGDKIDQDCDGVDPKCPDPCVDGDGDGHAGPTAECPTGDDCNDENALVSPGATEICGDAVDQDCDGKDEACPPTGCTKDSECAAGLWCDTTTKACVEPQPWQWFAPIVYADTDKKGDGLDFPTNIDFDGDASMGNNGDNVYKVDRYAYAYFSRVSTDTHDYVGYHFYFPRRWSDAFLFPTQYENTVRSVLLVIRKSGGPKGTIELMATTAEDGAWKFYQPSGGKLLPYWYDDFGAIPLGTIKFDSSSGHPRPIVYMDAKTHDISGNKDWDKNGFPGSNGFILRWSFKAGKPVGLIGESTYALRSLQDEMWSKRFEIGDTKYFKSFGKFAGDELDEDSAPPWGMRASYWYDDPYGEILYDPTTFVRRNVYGWVGAFSVKYATNPYAIRVDVHDLYVKGGGDPFGGDPDPFVNLYMRDGRAVERLVLGYTGIQNSWYASDIEPYTLINLKEELGRYWFYGLEAPGADYFGIEVKDDDAVADDWLMDPGKRHYYKYTGLKFLDWVLSDSYVKCELP